MHSAATALKIGLGLLAAGLVFASGALLVPGAALVLLTVSLTLWVGLAGRGASIRRSGLPGRVGEGEAFDLCLSGRTGMLPLLGELVDPAVGSPLSVRSLRPRERYELRLQGALPRRGRHRLAAPMLRIADPLGIVSRPIASGEPASILVLPRIEPLRGPADSDAGPAVGRLSSGAGELTAGGLRDSAADPEIDGLRPYRAGTRASRIYWPALARNGELVERNLAPTAESGPLVVLDASAAADDDALDRAVRAAASLTAHLARFGGCELLLSGERRRHSIGGEGGAWHEAHAALALVEASDGPPRLPRLAPGTALAWVSAGDGTGAPATFTRGYLITPDPLPGRRVTFTVAGCHAHPLAAPIGARQRREVAA